MNTACVSEECYFLITQGIHKEMKMAALLFELWEKEMAQAK